jgi:hypothetical protein
MTAGGSQYLAELHKQLDRSFSLEEVRGLCFELGVDFDNVAGEGKSARIRNLILQMARRDQLQELVDAARRERPHAGWPDAPADFELPRYLSAPETALPANVHYYGPVTTYGEQITVGNISDASGIAIGSHASASVTSTATAAGGDSSLDDLFAPLREQAVARSPRLAGKVDELRAQAALGTIDDTAIANLIQDIVDAEPATGPTLVALFANHRLAVAAGGAAASFVLGRIKGK